MNHALGIILAAIAAGIYTIKLFADRDPKTPIAAKLLMVAVSVTLLFMSAGLLSGVIR